MEEKDLYLLLYFKDESIEKTVESFQKFCLDNPLSFRKFHLEMAWRYKHAKIVNYILEKSPIKLSGCSLDPVTIKNDPELVECILTSQKETIAIVSDNLLVEAIELSNFELFSRLLDRCSIDLMSSVVLKETMKHNNREILTYLLEKKCFKHMFLSEILNMCYRNDSISLDLVDYFLEKGQYDLNKGSPTILRDIACGITQAAARQLAFVDVLMKHGASMHYSKYNTPYGSPVSGSVYWKNLPLLQYFLSKGALAGEPFLVHYIVGHWWFAALEYISKNYADFPVNSQDPQGDTPLHFASKLDSKQDRIKIAELLLNTKRCDLTLKNKKGETALSNFIGLQKDEENGLLLLKMIDQQHVPLESHDDEALMRTSRMLWRYHHGLKNRLRAKVVRRLWCWLRLLIDNNKLASREHHSIFLNVVCVVADCVEFLPISGLIEASSNRHFKCEQGHTRAEICNHYKNPLFFRANLALSFDEIKQRKKEL